MPSLSLRVGAKTDPVEYRYSYPWLFRILASEGVRDVQLGTFFELYQLPDSYFAELRRQAADHGLRIHSLFTSHRELGGFFREEAGFVAVARGNYERLIEVGALLGARSVGCNPGAVLRDRPETKRAGVCRYVEHMRALMRRAADAGLEWLTIEPMSCEAEPPTLPAEIVSMAAELDAFRASCGRPTARVGYCADVSHGYADADRRVVFGPMHLLGECLPWLYELHLRNTDPVFESTFGFTEDERERGIVRVDEVRDLLLARQAELPVDELVGYLEIGGPKLGRDYSDRHLEGMLRESLRHCREAFETPGRAAPAHGGGTRVRAPEASVPAAPPAVRIAPSVMCADMGRLAEELARLEDAGADMLHFDIMDARFAPNMPLGLLLPERLRAVTALPFDLHLMVCDNGFFVSRAAEAGAQWVSVHVESAVHLDRTLSEIRERGMLAGAALNPSTPLDRIAYVLDRLDFVLLMMVNPGFAGQSLVPATLPKIAACRRMLDATGRPIPIEVDGNVSFASIPRMVAAGADILVAGSSSLFDRDASLAANAANMRRAIAEGVALRADPPRAATGERASHGRA